MEQSDLTVLQQQNLGSARGFSTGIEHSIRRGHSWPWIFDDDAVPRTDGLEELVRTPYFGRPDTVFMASRVVDRSGTSYMSPIAANANRWYASVLDDGACWLGLLVSSAAVKSYGLPIAEFFLWEEDLEFTERLARSGPKRRRPLSKSIF